MNNFLTARMIVEITDRDYNGALALLRLLKDKTENIGNVIVIKKDVFLKFATDNNITVDLNKLKEPV